MIVLTRRICADQAASRWVNQYPDSRLGTRRALRALGASPDPDEIDRIVGNDSWTKPPLCDECGGESPAVVKIGDVAHYGATAWICIDCIHEAAVAFAGEGFAFPEMPT